VLSSKPILLVEDDSVDAMTVKRAIEDLGSKDTLVRSANGEEALDYLRNETNKRPRLILLDLNMPKMNGIEFLKHIKADNVLKRVPVIVLTTSMEDQDILRSFELSIAGYVVKPLDYKKFVEIIRTISQYWALSQLPCTG